MTEPILEARALTKTYKVGRREIPVLRGVDLSVGAGEMVALLGASGAGKSTLLHLLGLLDRPTSGEVRFGGEAVQNKSTRERAALRHREVGFIFQFYHLIPELNALQNVALGQMMLQSPMAYLADRRKITARAKALLEEVGLSERMRHQPSRLSGGEKQRVAIARALIAQPRVILADEPTGNLDTQTADGVLDLMFSINKEHGISYLLVTHNEELAKRCHRIVQMRDGVVID